MPSKDRVRRCTDLEVKSSPPTVTRPREKNIKLDLVRSTLLIKEFRFITERPGRMSKVYPPAVDIRIDQEPYTFISCTQYLSPHESIE